MDAVAIIDQVLLKVTRALVNVQIRDRFLKVLQYSIRFIIAYYSRFSTKDIIQKLEDSFMIVSNSRKFFRLFNSVGSIKQVTDILRYNSFAADPVGTSLQIATQTFWVRLTELQTNYELMIIHLYLGIFLFLRQYYLVQKNVTTTK
jgi:hypothetical protein